MNITEVRVKLLSGYEGDDKLRGFCSITIDNEYVVRDIKIIEGARGLFIAMPSRRVTARCSKCSNKNHLRARFCNECGIALKKRSDGRGEGGASRLFVDIAHPINQQTRQRVHERIIAEFDRELERAESHGRHEESTDRVAPRRGQERRDDPASFKSRSMEAGG